MQSNWNQACIDLQSKERVMASDIDMHLINAIQEFMDSSEAFIYKPSLQLLDEHNKGSGLFSILTNPLHVCKTLLENKVHVEDIILILKDINNVINFMKVKPPLTQLLIIQNYQSSILPIILGGHNTNDDFACLKNDVKQLQQYVSLLLKYAPDSVKSKIFDELHKL